MRVRILPYAMRSSGARRLSEALQAEGVDCLRVNPDGAYKPRIGDLIVIWGHGRTPEWWSRTKGIRVLNHPESVCTAINKIEAFKTLHQKVSIPPWTTIPGEAFGWLTPGNGIGCLARTQVEGMDGSGIVPIYNGTEYGWEGEPFPKADLYTKFIQSKAEFRIHVFAGHAIIWQKKGPTPDGGPITDEHIRTERNGWAFLKTPMKEIPDEVLEQAVRAVNALRLDFGGVDVLWDGEQAWVLEVNTAPSIVGTDVQAYTKELLNRVSLEV